VPSIEEQVAGLQKRVDKMDTELKEHFDDQQRFISGALAGVEKRLGEQIAGFEKRLGKQIAGFEKRLGEQIAGVENRLGARVDKMDRDMHAAFAGMESKLSVLTELVRDTSTRRSRRG
jgi:hypothetical protein